MEDLGNMMSQGHCAEGDSVRGGSEGAAGEERFAGFEEVYWCGIVEGDPGMKFVAVVFVEEGKCGESFDAVVDEGEEIVHGDSSKVELVDGWKVSWCGVNGTGVEEVVHFLESLDDDACGIDEDGGVREGIFVS